jgi:hypothetical protein
MRSGFVCDPHVIHPPIEYASMVSAPAYMLLILGRYWLPAKLSCVCETWRAGATASVSCSMCQAGTYGTGSGEGLRLRISFTLTSTLPIFVLFLRPKPIGTLAGT